MIRKIAFSLLLFCFYFGLSPQATCHSQAPEKFIILNLHWEKNAIRLNALHIAKGIYKAKRALKGENSFFYRVFSADKTVIDEGSFEVPKQIHFDYLDNENGQLSGGPFLRPEVDFVIKIPAHENSHKILFYRAQNLTDGRIHSNADTKKERIGEINLRLRHGI